MQIVIVGGPLDAVRNFTQKLQSHKIEVVHHYESPRVKRILELPKRCDGVIVIKNYCSHGLCESAIQLAKKEELRFAIVDYQWSRAEYILRQKGFFEPHEEVPEVRKQSTIKMDSKPGPQQVEVLSKGRKALEILTPLFESLLEQKPPYSTISQNNAQIMLKQHGILSGASRYIKVLRVKYLGEWADVLVPLSRLAEDMGLDIELLVSEARAGKLLACVADKSLFSSITALAIWEGSQKMEPKRVSFQKNETSIQEIKKEEAPLVSGKKSETSIQEIKKEEAPLISGKKSETSIQKIKKEEAPLISGNASRVEEAFRILNDLCERFNCTLTFKGKLS